MHIASKNGYGNVVKYLVEHGADINKTDKRRRTPLYIASENGHEVTFEHLIEHRTDVNKADENEKSSSLLALRIHDVLFHHVTPTSYMRNSTTFKVSKRK